MGPRVESMPVSAGKRARVVIGPEVARAGEFRLHRGIPRLSTTRKDGTRKKKRIDPGKRGPISRKSKEGQCREKDFSRRGNKDTSHLEKRGETRRHVVKPLLVG